MRTLLRSLAVLLAVLIAGSVAGRVLAGVSDGGTSMADKRCKELIGLARGGPNMGGTLVAYNPRLRESEVIGHLNVCAQGTIPTACPRDAASCRIDGATSEHSAIWKFYCAFPAGSAPRLLGVVFGLIYDEHKANISRWGSCGDFQLPDTGWPGSGTADAVTWDHAQTALMVPVYWFSTYVSEPTTITFSQDTGCGGPLFGDDSVPAVLDEIAGFGTMGFDMPGTPACPPEPTGACCVPTTGACSVITQASCASPNEWHSNWTTCSPNQCMIVPVERRTWGQIKQTYRCH